VRALLIAQKKRKPHWGPKKIADVVGKRRPELTIPAASTIGEFFKREGLVQPRRQRRTPLVPPAWVKARTPADAPNRVWTIDFKGEFRLGNGELCYPLTVVDLFSRDPRVIQALPSTHGAPVQDVLRRVFRRDGLPEVIRSDCGSPFATNAVAGLSQLAIWWLKLGIRLERNDPGHPEQNGAHERMHRTLKAETARPPHHTFEQQQRRFDAFRREYSRERPHEGIGMRRPAQLYVRSERPMPTRVPQVSYPGHFERRNVNRNGCIKWRGELLFVSEVLHGEQVGIEDVEEGVWSLYFGSTLLGRFGPHSWSINAAAPE
jgi:transposase InsO family protein